MRSGDRKLIGSRDCREMATGAAGTLGLAEPIRACALLIPDYPVVFGDLGPFAVIDWMLRSIFRRTSTAGAPHSLWILTSSELIVLEASPWGEPTPLGLIGRWSLLEVKARRIRPRMLLIRAPIALEVTTPSRTLRVRSEVLDDDYERLAHALCEDAPPLSG
jgi:hypothetical protein